MFIHRITLWSLYYVKIGIFPLSDRSDKIMLPYPVVYCFYTPTLFHCFIKNITFPFRKPHLSLDTVTY